MSDEPTRPSLVRQVILTVVGLSLLSMVMQIAIVFAQLYLNERDLMVSFVTHEVEAMANAVRATPDGLKVKMKGLPSRYLDLSNGAYAYKISMADGTVLAEHRRDMIEAVSPWNRGVGAFAAQQDLWIANLEPAEQLHIAGGERFIRDAQTFQIEVATLGDPQNAIMQVLLAEVIDDVWMPMTPLLLFTLIGAVFVVHRALRPLAEMAQLVETTSRAGTSLNTGRRRLPKEVASFVTAITMLLARVESLLASQRLFVARAAHELRTPLAALLLETDRFSGADAAR
ncbi:MAG: hypothetical protein JSS20_18570, partial [Proteobacteria bacterium]|nr:hypothetical protein [Pseudomonadota bacterium]